MMRDDEIFAEALALPPEERAAWLDRECAGDAALRGRVEALLRGHEAASDFLERPPVERPLPSIDERTGDAFGRYTLSRKVGEGGYGVVWLADQHEPVRRHVALKIIKLGMDTRQVITRFEAERQALAMMDHPDIARVFDAGATESGRPYFVMEFVDGVPITRYCDEHGLPVAARLELFSRVCVALQHAHQKGVIHRDLKPSNVLVTLRDGAPAPKIIDFGIAKATRGRLTDRTLVTDAEQFIGTPAYMSPEQAEQRELEIDTRSDIYSLGVLLYELLAGRLPYDPQSLVRAGLDEIRRIIREVEPARPSTRVSTLANADRATVARLRGVAPTRLSAVLRGDLDWIVMRCLEKDRERRYGTAHELADDVRRHLRSEPVVARPPETLYRVRKFVARNRLACASAAIVAAALIVGTMVSVRAAVRASRAERIAQAERTDAQRRQEQAEALLAFMLGDFRTELKKLGQTKLLDSVGEKALAYFASAEPRDLTDTALTRQVKALTQIGETRIDQARFPEADAVFGAALARATMLTTRHPRDADMLFERAQVEYWIGFVARRRGNRPAEREWLTRYRDTAVELVALERGTLRAQREVISGHHNLAVLELNDGNLAAARSGFLTEQTALTALLSDNPENMDLLFRLADVASWLGNVARKDGRYADALTLYADHSARVEQLVALEPRVPRWKHRHAESLSFAAEMQAVTGRTKEALETYGKARQTMEELMRQDLNNQQWHNLTLSYRLRQVALLLALGDLAAAAPLSGETRRLLEARHSADPSILGVRIGVVTAWRLEAWFGFATNSAGADSAIARALEIGDEMVRKNPSDENAHVELAQVCLLAGRFAARRQQTDVARGYWERTHAGLSARLTS